MTLTEKLDAVTNSPGEPWRLTFDNIPDEEFVDGLRLSTDCPARRLIEPMDPERFHEFPEQLGRRGHGIERVLQEWMRDQFGVIAEREIVVPWWYGESHLDMWIEQPSPAFDTNGQSLVLEVKANKEAQIKPENCRQMQRQLYAVELAVAEGKQLRYRTLVDGEWVWRRLDPARLLEAQWRLFVVDPLTWNVPDPRGVRVSLTDDRRAELDAEWQAMRDFMALSSGARQWNIETPSKMPACTCGKCFRPELQELDEECAEHAALYLQAQEESAFAVSEQELQRDWLLERLAQGLPDSEGAPFVGHGFRVTVSKPTKKGTRSVRVTRSDAKVGPTL